MNWTESYSKLTVIHVLLIVHRSFGVVELLIVVKLPLIEVVVPLLLLLCVASVHWWGVEGSLVPRCWLVDVTGRCRSRQVAWGRHLCKKNNLLLIFFILNTSQVLKRYFIVTISELILFQADLIILNVSVLLLLMLLAKA